MPKDLMARLKRANSEVEEAPTQLRERIASLYPLKSPLRQDLNPTPAAHLLTTDLGLRISAWLRPASLEITVDHVVISTKTECLVHTFA